MQKETIVESQGRTCDFDNCKIHPAIDGEKINRIKDGYYKVMDGLQRLMTVLDNKELSSELKIAKDALKIMKKSTLENLWMRNR